MDNPRSVVSSFITLLVSLYLCIQCSSDYFKGGDKKLISNYETMISENTIVEGNLHPNYKEITVKIMKVPIKTYEFRYFFILDGKRYENTYSFKSELPKSYKINVYYLRANPNINCVNPSELLAEEKGKNASSSNLYWGIGWGIVGLMTLRGMWKRSQE